MSECATTTIVIKSRLPSTVRNFFIKYNESGCDVFVPAGMDPINVFDEFMSPNSCETTSEQLSLPSRCEVS